ncbi:MAG: L-glutamate gamma-semialdehyde dehydrogenase [Gemmataceae bacterium]|nr:L-glutamate gamma-semialdehyde dehydrogenase [Gemmataceae bacterium]MCI0743302.1 L-glutamate gamma-semialdehyde dehydrogenase [Gemmataceae bacterium]
MIDFGEESVQLQELERRTKAFGQEIFARVEGPRPILFSPAWWDERLMEGTMGDESVKVQLFRFIDVLPLLDGEETVCRHLREYFEEAHEHLPGWARFGLRFLPERGWAARIVAKAARHNAYRMARRFIAGSNLEEALQAVASMRRRKLAFTVDLLGEATITEAEAQKSQEDYLHLVQGLSQAVNSWPEIPLIDRDNLGPIPRVNVSIKLSSLYSQFDPIDPVGTSAVVRDRLRPILQAAQRRGVFVNIDMEQHAFKDLTLRIFKEILEEPQFADWPDAGIAIQCYLRDCEKDLRDLADWARQRGTPVWVRLIKGAYWDFETVVAAQEGWPLPVFERKHETDANYEKLSLFLLENQDVLRPAFGSHNIRSLAHALAAAQLLGLPENAYEIQMLYGMAEPIKDALAAMGQRVRVYTPYGQLLPGMAYLVRRLLENTANESFLRASFTERVSEEKLLMKPSNSGVRSQGSGVRGQGSGVGGNSDGHAHDAGHAAKVADVFRNEPVADFSQEEARAAMQAALEQVKKELGRSYPLVIGGRRIETAQAIDSHNPSHVREIVGKCGRANVEQARQAVEAAKAAFLAWRDTAPHVRADFLVRAADAMRRRRFELCAWENFECAKQWREADADVCEAIDFCEYYAREMRRLAYGRRVDLPGENNFSLYEPRGVAVVIAPWNFPLAILTGMTTAALVTGNTVIMKPAEQSSVIGAKLMEVFEEIGLPAGVVNFLPGIGEEIGPTLVEHPDVALIAFTGSRGVGMTLNRQAAELMPGQTHIKKLIAELGGKNAIIVDDDADLDEAVSGVAASAFGYQGQKCSACSRVIVLESIHDVFLQRLVEATKSLKIAPAEDPSCKVGPVIDEEARRRILQYVEKGKQEARLAFAGELGFVVNEGTYVAPHIFANVPPHGVLAQEEIFGPVLAVIKVRDLDEALRVANGTSYALTGGLYSRSPEHIECVKREFRVGNLYINRKITGALVHRQPFGGFKLSGIGSKAGGPDYLLQFVLPRTITENTMRRGFAPKAEEE